jgi:hypothetical protein
MAYSLLTEEDKELKIGETKKVDGRTWTLKDTTGDGKYGEWHKQGAFSATAEKIGKKMDAVLNDSNKTTKLLMALNTITESSKMEPLSSGRVKTPLGKITSGVTKGLIQGKQIQSAETLSKAKYMKALMGPETINIGGADYSDDYFRGRMNNITDNRDAHEKSAINLANRFTMVQGIKDRGIPTGLLPSLLQPFEELLLGIFPAGSEQYEAYSSLDPSKLADLDLKDKVKFKTGFEALVRQATLDLAKQVYPVSEKDLVILQQSLGSVRTYGEALKQMLALQSGVSERNLLFYEGLDKYMATMPKNPMAKVTIDGVTAVGFEQFAKKYADSKIKERYAYVTQGEVNAVLGTGIDVKSLQPFQLAVVANAMKLAPSKLDSPDLAVLDTMFRIDVEAETLEKEIQEMDDALKDLEEKYKTK